MRAVSRIRCTHPFTVDFAADEVMTAWNYPVLAMKSKLSAVGARKNNLPSGAWMARNLHLFANFMESARSILRDTADEILAQPERRRALKNFLIFF
jgi:hypothetical protein